MTLSTPAPQARPHDGSASDPASTVNRSANHHAETGLQRAGRALGNLVLNLLAIAGTVCVIAVIAAFVFNISLIMFKTGSMSPTIPTGSLAIVKQVPANDVKVGDVVTIDRPGRYPVTHRVTSISPDVTSGHMVITMQGDANDTPDPEPYYVDTVRKVLWSIPELGYLVARAQHPMVMAVATVAMALLVTWAFWPRFSARRSVAATEATTRGNEATDDMASHNTKGDGESDG